MEKNSDREVSELLKQLEEFVEKDQTAKSSEPKSDPKSSDFSVEELLDQLSQHVGNAAPSEGELSNAGEYDIADDIAEFSASEDEEEASTDVDSLEPAVEDVKTETRIFEEAVNELSTCAEGELSVSDDAPLYDAPVATEETVPVEEIEEKVEEEIATVTTEPSVDEAIEGEVSEEEALRRQVESFVLETLDPEDEPSILDSIAGLAARNKEDNGEAAEKEMLSDSEDEPEDIAEEVLEQVVEQEELPADYVSNGMMDRFFKKNSSNSDVEPDDVADYKDFDDVDINLALTLGCEEDLHEAFGFSRVRASKNGFHDPAEETLISSSVYAGDGSEFRSYEQVDEIKARYKKEKRSLYKRFALTFLLTVFVLFFEHIFLTNISIPYVTEFFAVPWRYYVASLFLTALCILCSWKQLLGGCRSICSMTPDPYTPPAFFAFLNFIYELVVLFVYPEDGLLTYNFVLAIFLLFAVANEYMRLMRESMTFDVISDKKSKLSLERFEGEGEMKRDGSYLGRHDFFVEKVSFVGNYFSRVGKIPMRHRIYGFGFVSILLGGAAMMLVSAQISGELGNTFQTFFFWMMLCVPIQYLILGEYPFYLLSKGLKKQDSAILGESVVDEYAATSTIYLGDDEMFGRHGASIVGLRLYGDMDFYELLYYAFAVFSHLGAPLCHVFDTSTKEIPRPQEVKINAVSVGGIEATVDGEHKVLVGNMAFVRSKGFFPKRNIDDEKKIENGQASIVYIVVDGILSAKLYIKYSVTKRFEKFVDEMVSNGISVGIRSLDPSVNSRMISILREYKDPDIQVIHPTANELVAIGKHSDSGIITGRNSHMIFRILQQCLHIRSVHRKQTIFYLISILLGAVGVVALMLTNRFGTIPSLVVAVYHILWVIIGTIYTKSKLK